MAQAYTKGDSLGIYQSLADSNGYGRGGSRSPQELGGMAFLTDTPHPQISILAISGENGNGRGVITATDDDKLTWTPPGGTAGTAVTIAANETVLLEGSTPSKWARVFWDGDYSTDTLGDSDSLQLLTTASIVNANRDATSYSALFLTNHSILAQDITSIKVWLGTLGTQRTTNTTQLASSGAGTIVTTGSFSDWPAKGWAHIKTSGGTTREIVYYSSRTNTTLTVPSAGRGLLGTSAAAGASSDTVDAVPGIRIGKETQASDGRIQEIASLTTEPTGITWSNATTSATGLTHTALASNDNLGLWIRTETPAIISPYFYYPVRILLEYTVGGATYTNAIRAMYSVRDTSIDLYEVYAGVDANPNFSAAPSATSATLPIVYALTPPGSGEREYRVTLRKRNAFDMVSQNIYTHDFTIDSTGAIVGGELTAPQNVTVANIGNGKLRIKAYYPKAIDSDPADTWIGYFGFGADPDPAVDSPVTLGTVGEADLLTGRVYFSIDTVSFDWNTDFRVILRVQRSDDSAESTNLDVVSAIVDSGEVPQRFILSSGMDRYNFISDSLISLTEINETPAVYLYAYYGLTILQIDGTVVLRAVVNDAEGGRVYVNNLLGFDISSISGSGTGDIEVVDADTVYLNVAGNRQCLIDLSGNVIQAAQINVNGNIDDNPNTGPLDTVNGKLYLSVYNLSRNVWEPFLQVAPSSVITFGYPVIQKET